MKTFLKLIQNHRNTTQRITRYLISAIKIVSIVLTTVPSINKAIAKSA